MILHGREIEVHVDDIEPFANDKYTGFKILWCGNIGWGEYIIYKETGDEKWYTEDECMEVPKGDTTFLKILFDDFIKQLEEKK